MRVPFAVVLIAVVSTAGGLALVTAARSDNPVLTAVSGLNDGYVISLEDASGVPVANLNPGTYTVAVHDPSIQHNFHLLGAGLDKATSILGTGDLTWTVTLAQGYYRFLCDPHVARMHGDFTVGSGARPLAGLVGPGRTVTLSDAFRLPPKALVPGRYVITVRDRSRNDNLHLHGPRVNRMTGIAFRGTVHWALTLRPGRYTYRSDVHPATRRSFAVRASG